MADTREYIIEKAYSLFLNHSYEGVSINDISKAIGLTKGALYHHFASKEELFKAVIDKYLNIQETPVKDEDTSFAEFIDLVVEHARDIIYSVIKMSDKFMPLNYISLIIDALRHYPEFSNLKDKMFSSHLDTIKKILQNAIKRKEIRNDINVELTAFNFFSLSYGLAGSILQSNDPEQSIKLLKAQLLEMYKVIKV